MQGKWFRIENDKLNAVIAAMLDMHPACTDTDVLGIIDGDWPEGAEHQAWLDSASVQEITDWVDGIYVNMIEPGKDEGPFFLSEDIPGRAPIKRPW